MTEKRDLGRWVTNSDLCNKCGGKFTVKKETRIQSLIATTLACPNGHEVVRYRLIDVGE